MKPLKIAALILAVLLIVIIPFIIAGPRLEAWSAAWLDAVRDHPRVTALVVILLLAADVVLPIPSSIVSVASGGVLGFTWGTFASTAGMSLGCLAGYGLGRAATARARARARRVSRNIDIDAGTDTDVDDSGLTRTFARHGDWIVIASRAIPVLAESSTMLAGMARMSLPRFLMLTTLANIGIAAVNAYAGVHAAGAQSFLLALAAAVILPALPLVWLRATHRGRQLQRALE